MAVGHRADGDEDARPVRVAFAEIVKGQAEIAGVPTESSEHCLIATFHDVALHNHQHRPLEQARSQRPSIDRTTVRRYRSHTVQHEPNFHTEPVTHLPEPQCQA